MAEIDKNLKHWIDNATYTQLLARWRNAPAGDPAFILETGNYYSKIMNEKKSELSHSEQVQASKNIGWKL